MGQVDQVTQRNASAAEELSSTAEEMSSQAESLQQLMAFFAVSEQVLSQQRFQAMQHKVPALSHAGAVAQGPVKPARPALPQKNGGGHSEGGFKKF
jgi:methyl-accepting chemotaxis protein